MSLRDRLQRRVIPRAIVALSTVRLPRRIAAAARRALRGRATVRLFVAFDDAQSAVAVIGIVPRLARRRARLVIEPVVRRGIPGDPAAEDKRRYAVVDAGRLLRRDGHAMSRTAPIAAGEVAFLAAWAAAAPPGPRAGFTEAAMRELWLASDGRVDRERMATLYRDHVGAAPPADGGGGPARHERAMRRRRLYDTPVAVVHGQWFFAHERLGQIEHRLDELGWRAQA